MHKSFIYLAFALLFIGTTTAVNAVPVLSLSDGTGGTPAAGSSHGWTFTANQDLLVTDLGLYDGNLDGFDISHEIGLFRLSDGALLTSGVLSSGTSNDLIDNFRYVDTADVFLTSGETYVISYYSATSSTDFVVTSATDLVVDPAITILNSNWQYTSGLALPINISQEDRFGPNFLYTSVPEPGTLALLSLGLVALAFGRRKLYR